MLAHCLSTGHLLAGGTMAIHLFIRYLLAILYIFSMLAHCLSTGHLLVGETMAIYLFTRYLLAILYI